MTFILFLRFKNEARKQRKIFFGPIKKNGNKIATLAKMSHSYFYLDLFKVHLTTFLYEKNVFEYFKYFSINKTEVTISSSCSWYFIKKEVHLSPWYIYLLTAEKTVRPVRPILHRAIPHDDNLRYSSEFFKKHPWSREILL